MPETRKQPTLLITRPQAGAERFSQQAAHLGLATVIAPLMRIVPVDHDAAVLANARGLVFTSEHAVASAAPGRGRPAFCVGVRTAEIARAAGFDVTEGPGDAARLAPMLTGLGPGWVHPCGRHLAADLGLPMVTVYDQIEQPLSDTAHALLSESAPVILPLFSPRSARIAGRAMQDARAPLLIAAISAAAGAAWGGPTPARQLVADKPNAQGLLNVLKMLCDQET